ncbi:hypothetical protein GCM10010885_05840 [Alicyclobacillus cellulosilyticus]|uniref:UDP-glucose/GDP-mannose dehydrogenase family protein n=1 Tax=Alicyclobacillus cellulosilyticus TaxID=1003997 RepID=A0A917K344_9BACL|nr:hypothetical protein GCM10010885_05840 [Alicyclobacillus cellulosilyticus]
MALAHYLRHRGARVRAFDPTVPIQFPYQTETLAACLDGADAVAVAAWQPAFDGVAWREALAHACAPLVLLDPKHRLQSRLSPCGAGVDAASTGSCMILADPASATVQHAGHTAPGGRVAR